MKRLILPISLTFLGCSQFLSAQDTPSRIAVVNMTAVFKAHPKTATAEAQIERQKMEARDVFIEKKKALEDVLKDHQSVTQKLVASGSNSSVADKELARTLLDEATKLEKEIATLRTTQANDLKNSFVKERRQILDEISTAIVKFNAEGKYAVILDSSAQSTNGIPQVIHAPGAVDITPAITALVKSSK